MRSILAFVIVVALALGTYKFFSSDGDKGGSNATQMSGNYQKPSVPRPSTGQPNVSSTTSPTVAGPELSSFAWEDQVSEEYLVRMEEAWDVDLSGVDLEADVLCTVGGVEITQQHLQQWVAVKHGQAIVNSYQFEALGRAAAEETGLPYGMTDEQWELYFQEYIDSQGGDRELVLNYQAYQMKVPADAVEGIRRRSIEGILAMLPPVETSSELPLNLDALLATDTNRLYAASFGNLMQDTIEKLTESQGRVAAPVHGLVDQATLMFATIGPPLRFQRSWDVLYTDLPEGVLAAIHTGEVPEDQILAPWELTGDRVLIQREDVYNKVRAVLSDIVLREDLREVIWYEVLKANLAEDGHLPTDSEMWTLFASAYLSMQPTFYNMDLTAVSDGYANRSMYLADMRIQEGFERSQPENWLDEEILRTYYENNGFFVQGWDPDLELAFFPPFDAERMNLGEPDWEMAEASALAFLTQIENGGDFSSLREQQNMQVIDDYRSANQEYGDGLALELRDGKFKTSMASINQILRQSPWDDRLNGVSPLRNVVVRLGPGEVSPPWKTPVGYFVFKMNGASMGRLEREFEDVEDLTLWHYRGWKFRDWVTRELRGLTVELP